MQNVSWGPNDLPFHILRSNNIFSKSLSTLTLIDLGELEDLYYAACGKLKELLGRVNLYLFNKFKAPEDPYFTYTSKAYKHLGTITVGEFKAFLLAQEEILYNNGMLKMMSKAVRRKNEREAMKKNSHERVGNPNDVSPGEERGFPSPYIRFSQGWGWPRDIGGLRDIREQPCGMIFGELAEKYRTIIHKERLEGLRKQPVNKNYQIFAEQGKKQCDPHTTYISPYNLGERPKKPNMTGGAEVPCICDQEYIYAPLCAGDLAQNHLREENGLLCRVIEGWDIDDSNLTDLRNKKKRVSQDVIAQTCQEAGSWDVHARTSTSSAVQQAPISQPINQNESHLSQHEPSDVAYQTSPSQDSITTSVPQYMKNLSIWATPSLLGSRPSPCWHTLHELSSKSCLPSSSNSNTILASCASKRNESASIQARGKLPFVRRFLGLCRRNHHTSRDVLQMIRMSDKEEGREKTDDVPTKHDSQEIVFDGLTYIIRRLP